MSAPLILTTAEDAAFERLRELAAARPVDMRGIHERLQSPEGKQAHREHMTSQTVFVPLVFDVTFSIELNHPCGACRHMSMSSRQPNHLPVPQAVWMICEKLGFVGELRNCTIWFEELDRPGGRLKAVNVVQPIAAIAASSRPS